MGSLLEISCVLENPFTDGPNQLPIIDGHERFVELIRTVYHSRAPLAYSSDEETKDLRDDEDNGRRSRSASEEENGKRPEDETSKDQAAVSFAESGSSNLQQR